MPREIRIYPIHGPATKNYARWQPRDVIINTAESVLETIIHESAHILEAHRHGVMAHEQAFVTAYCDIEATLVAAGVCQSIGPEHRFSGCPAGSYAAMQFGRRRYVHAEPGASPERGRFIRFWDHIGSWFGTGR
jgi:hypothetical protein